MVSTDSATIASASLPSPAERRDGNSNPFGGVRTFLGAFLARAFDPYRPELHYMRGPGPACRAKQATARRKAN